MNFRIGLEASTINCLRVPENILAAISAADPDAAERAMKEHFQFVEELIAPKPRRAARRVK